MTFLCTFLTLHMDQTDPMDSSWTSVSYSDKQCVCATLFLSLSHQATFVFSLVCWSPLSLGKGIVAPGWATALGWLLTLSSVSLLPLCALYALATTPGSLTQVSHTVTFLHQQPTTTLGPTITLTPTLTVTLAPTVQHCTMWTDSTLTYLHLPCDLPYDYTRH